MPQFATEYWQDTNSRVEFTPADTPPELPVTAVKIYVFQDDKLLLTNIVSRGWDLPGGHVEPGETNSQAISRELKEETGMSVKRIKVIGYLKVTNERENERNRKYPEVSCILVYKGYDVTSDIHHRFRLEASESRFVSIDGLPNIHHEWNKAKEQVVSFAATY